VRIPNVPDASPMYRQPGSTPLRTYSMPRSGPQHSRTPRRHSARSVTVWLCMTWLTAFRGASGAKMVTALQRCQAGGGDSAEGRRRVRRGRLSGRAGDHGGYSVAAPWRSSIVEGRRQPPIVRRCGDDDDHWELSWRSETTRAAAGLLSVQGQPTPRSARRTATACIAIAHQLGDSGLQRHDFATRQGRSVTLPGGRASLSIGRWSVL